MILFLSKRRTLLHRQAGERLVEHFVEKLLSEEQANRYLNLYEKCGRAFQLSLDDFTGMLELARASNATVS
jgi:hypothetical protein